MKIFGCDAYALVSKNHHSKSNPKSKRYSFVGYGDRVKGYRLWDPTTHKIIIRRHVVFDDSFVTKSNSIENNLEEEEVTKYQ